MTTKLSEARTLFAEGQAAYREGRLLEARAKLEQANRLVPTTELEFDLGRICERIGETGAAIGHFRRYLKATRNKTEHKQVQARIDAMLAREARHSEELLDLPPSRAQLTAEARTFFERGKKLFRRGAYEAALAAFAAAMRFVAAPELTYNLALTAERLGQVSDAVDYYRAYLRETDNSSDAERVSARISALLAQAATDRSHQPPGP